MDKIKIKTYIRYDDRVSFQLISWAFKWFWYIATAYPSNLQKKNVTLLSEHSLEIRNEKVYLRIDVGKQNDFFTPQLDRG